MKLLFALFLLPLLLIAEDSRFEISGNVEYEHRFFLENNQFQKQEDLSNSVAIQPEFYYEWNDGYDSITFTPFFRFDTHDSRRTHFDVRELFYLISRDDWEFRVGMRKVFWGVTESIHLVDTINQTDSVENIDGEEKLGQAMLNISYVHDIGTFDLFIMPHFRERTFAGSKGRLRSGVPVEIDDAEYESDAKEWHTDIALRYENTFDDLDLGLSYFYGTSREPRIELRPGSNGLEAIPVYDLIHQLGLDLQYTRDAWLWKLESIYRSGSQNDFSAMAAGFEYTFFDIQESGIDAGILLEYLWDSRNDDPAALFQNDVFLGSRITLNDVQSTEFLSGIIFDTEGGGHSFIIEASRRISDAWRLSLEVRTFHDASNGELLDQIHKDDHIQLTASYFF